MSNASSARDDNDGIDDDNDELHATSLDADETSTPGFEEKSNEPMRPVDVAQCWDPMFCSGDEEGLKEVTIMSRNPKRCPVLILSSGDMFPPDANVKRLRVIRRKKLEDHSFGLLRHVTEFKLHAAGDDDHGSFTQGDSETSKKTLLKHWSELQEKVGDSGMGSGSFHKVHNKSTDGNDANDVDDSETKSCAESVSDQSSVIGPGLLDKVNSKNENDDDVASVKNSETKSSLASVPNPSSAIGSASCDKAHNKACRTKSSPKLVSKPSPMMGSTLFHEVRNKNKDDDNDNDLEDS